MPSPLTEYSQEVVILHSFPITVVVSAPLIWFTKELKSAKLTWESVVVVGKDEYKVFHL